jgi:Uma2 family endonuclease
MDDLVFESTESIDQAGFATFVANRERIGDNAHYELLNGRVVMNPPAGYPHGEIGSAIQILLGGFVRQQRLGKTFDSSQGFELASGDTLEPDHSFVSHARWAAGPAPEFGKFLRMAPDLVVEVLSLRTASQDRGEKKAIYERNGVREYWLVDARARTLTVFVLQNGSYRPGQSFGAGERAPSSVLPGFSWDITELLP